MTINPLDYLRELIIQLHAGTISSPEMAVKVLAIAQKDPAVANQYSIENHKFLTESAKQMRQLMNSDVPTTLQQYCAHLGVKSVNNNQFLMFVLGRIK